MEVRVYETKKYSMFKKLDGNRDVYGVNKIIDSIMKVGYIPSPICVNEKYEVIDGQNRLEALKQLDMPVHYYIVKDIGLEEARQMNIGRKNWTPMDYLKSYAASGNENYVRFLELSERHEEYSLQELMGVLKGLILVNGWVTYSLKTGELSLTEKEVEAAEPVFALLDMVKPALSKIGGARRMAITAVAWILTHTKADKKRLISTINNKYPLFMPAVTPELFLKDISKHYNNGLTPAKRFSFDIEYRMETENL